MNWYLKVLKNYAVFSGRARRTEYWMFVLVNVIIALVIGLIEGILGSPAVLANLYSLAILIPSLAVAVRRLHDTGRSGWFLLLGLIPLIGPIVLIVFLAQDSQDGTNEYGAPPKAAADYIDI